MEYEVETYKTAD